MRLVFSCGSDWRSNNWKWLIFGIGDQFPAFVPDGALECHEWEENGVTHAVLRIAEDREEALSFEGDGFGKIQQIAKRGKEIVQVGEGLGGLA